MVAKPKTNKTTRKTSVKQSVAPKRSIAHRHAKAWLVVFLASAVVMVIVQLLYPNDRAVPFARLSGEMVGYGNRDAIVLRAQTQFQKSQIVLRAGQKVVTTSPSAAGAQVDSDKLADSLTNYPLWQRLIPFSLLAKWPYVNYQEAYYDGDVLRSFATASAPKLSSDAESARLKIAPNGTITVSDAVAGVRVTPEMIIDQLPKDPLLVSGASVVQIRGDVRAATRISKDFDSVRVQAEQAVGKSLVLRFEQKQYPIDRATLVSWLVVREDTDSATPPRLELDTDAFTRSLATITDELTVPAKNTLVDVQNGKERSRTMGTPGRTVDTTRLADTVRQVLFESKPDGIVVIPTVVVAPTVQYSNGFTATREGLQAYVDYMGRTKNVRIMITQLDGEQWSASARADETTVSGSTYKLYVSLLLFEKIAQGEIDWNTPILDTNVSGCFERMTVASTNPCAEKFIALFGGREAINDFVHRKGFSQGTVFSTGEAARTTAADLNKFMTGLNDGTLVGGADRERLLSSLSRHPYRYGIPTGSKGKVFDKVGFLWDYVNDTAIVRHPRGTYITTIMTKGESYARIAEITREVERLMYP